MAKHMTVKVTPGYFRDPALYALKSTIKLLCFIDVPRQPHTRPSRKGTGRMMHAQSRRAVLAWEVSRVFVHDNLLLQESFQPLQSCGFTSRIAVAQALPIFVGKSLVLRCIRYSHIEERLVLGTEAYRVLAWYWSLIEDMWMRVQVSNPVAVPWTVHCILFPAASLQRARRYHTVIVLW